MATPAQPMEQLFDKIRHLPPDRVTEVGDFVDFLSEKVQRQASLRHEAVDFPVISVGRWPKELNLSRQEMYNDDGR